MLGKANTVDTPSASSNSPRAPVSRAFSGQWATSVTGTEKISAALA
jgi:hypothetical protein